MLEGKAIYRDLFDHKPPAIHLVLAGTFYLFGDSTLSLRAIVIFFNIISAYVVYFFLRRVGERLGRFGGILFLLTVPLVHGTYALTEVFALPFLLIFAYFIVRHSEKWYVIIGGISLGIALLFKLTLLLTILVTVLYLMTYPQRFSQKVKGILYFCSGLLIPLIVLCVWLVRGRLLRDFYEQAIQYVALFYPPQITVQTLQLLVFLSFSLCGFVLLSYRSFKNNVIQKEEKYVLLVIILSFIPSILYRPYHHYWILIIPFLIIFSIFGAKGSKWGQRILFFNASVIAAVWMIYSTVFGYPKLLYQIDTAEKIENCAGVHDPIMHFLTRCIPREKYFYQVK
ncbi:glycosyltransferase family 39 protein [Candidatus Roizmanbacteria bacterium]|nr:glycosyltransferase family 39 protein [Candidatus Roizmanbacteria bacterium]